MKEKLLVPGVRVVVSNSVPIKKEAEAWRITLDYMSDEPDPEKLIKHYFVWVTGEYLEDEVGLKADINSAENYAISVGERRFTESNKQVPVENGMSFTNLGGEEIVDPRDYLHPDEHT